MPCPVDILVEKIIADVVNSIARVCEIAVVTQLAIFLRDTRRCELAIGTIAAVVIAAKLLVAVAAIFALFIAAERVLFRLSELVYSPLVVRAIWLLRRRPIGILALEVLDRNAANAN